MRNEQPKMLEVDAQLSRQRLSLYIQQTPLAVIEWDLEGRVLEWNPAAREIFGYTREEALGQHWTFIVPRTIWPNLAGVWAAIVERRGGDRSTNENITKSDRIISCEWFNTSLIDPDGRPVSVASLVMDVTERRRAEQELQESEKRYRYLFEHNPHPMWVYDKATLRFLEVNDAAVQHYGYSRAEFLAMTILDIHEPEAAPRIREATRHLGGEIRRPGVYRQCKKDGTFILADLTTHDLEYGHNPARLVLADDVTERERAEAERQKLQDQLAHAQKMESVGRLAGGVAHDFNNMLGVILGHAEMAMEQVEPTAPLFEDLREIQKAAQRSAELTRQLLTFARRQTVAPRVLDLNVIVGGMLKMLERLIGENIELVWKPGPDLWPVKMDPSQVDQILANLSVNARDAIAGNGKLTIWTENAVLDEKDCAARPGFVPGDYVRLTVGDTGTGMDEATLGHLFEPFFTTKEVGRGTGLGLATVYGIVRQNGGFIEVSSRPGQGTTLLIYLPRTAAEDSAADSAAAAVGEKTAQGSETVLLVEDEVSILNLGKTVLERYGYTVLAAQTPALALSLAEGHAGSIDLLISDVVMPGMNGKELQVRLTALRPGIKILFISGYTAEVIAHHGILDEGLEFLQKPFSVSQLAEKVRQLLNH